MSTMQVRDFHCNNCGAPLSIPKNSKGKVVCPSCKTECIIEGLVKNSEIQAKEYRLWLIRQCFMNVW